MSRAQAAARRRELERALAELHAATFDSSSSSAGVSASSDTDYPAAGLKVPEFQPPNTRRRVVSATQGYPSRAAKSSNDSSGNEDYSDDGRRSKRISKDQADLKRLSLGGSFDMLDQVDFNSSNPPSLPPKNKEGSGTARRRDVATSKSSSAGEGDESWGAWFRRSGKSSPTPK